MAADPVLLGLPYSPWSERARWALDVSGTPYTYRVYQPVIGEPGLRRAIGKWSGPVSVPALLLPDGSAIPQSNDIARWADRTGTLFPKDVDLTPWLDRAERGLAAGRALALRRVLTDDAALMDLVPKPLRVLGTPAARIAGIGVRRTLRKYGAPDDARATADLDEALTALRAALAGKPAPATIFDRFTYADIAMAQVLVFVLPPTTPHVRIGRGSRAQFTDPVRKEQYADVIAWRDALYARFRDVPGPADAAASSAT